MLWTSAVFRRLFINIQDSHLCGMVSPPSLMAASNAASDQAANLSIEELVKHIAQGSQPRLVEQFMSDCTAAQLLELARTPVDAEVCLFVAAPKTLTNGPCPFLEAMGTVPYRLLTQQRCCHYSTHRQNRKGSTGPSHSGTATMAVPHLLSCFTLLPCSYCAMPLDKRHATPSRMQGKGLVYGPSFIQFRSRRPSNQ